MLYLRALSVYDLSYNVFSLDWFYQAACLSNQNHWKKDLLE